MHLVENGIFNTEALKHSVKRLNQLGYFKQLEGNEAIKVEKTPQEKNQVDVTLKLEEQNRNQLHVRRRRIRSTKARSCSSRSARRTSSAAARRCRCRC